MGCKMSLLKTILRQVAKRKYEKTEDGGVYVPSLQGLVKGEFVFERNGEEAVVARNTITDEGILHILGTSVGGDAQIVNYYIAPFAGNVTPQATWTAANFASTATEFTNYDEGARVAWTPAAAAAAAIDNYASKATFTVGAGAQTTIWGAGILSASTKSSTSGVLIGAVKLGTAKSGLEDGETVSIGYRLTLANAP